MKISYFPDTDTLYLALSDRDSTCSEAINDHVIVDFDGDGRPVAFTLEHYSAISDQLSVETLLPVASLLQSA